MAAGTFEASNQEAERWHGAPPANEVPAAAHAEQERGKTEVAAACTTLCLWEPDAALMIRKAMGQERARKSEYAAEARKGGFAEAASESGASAEIRQFEEFFAVELRAVRDTMEQVMALQAATADTPKLFDWWHEQLRELQHLVSGASNFLPTQLREKFGRQIAEYEAKLKAERERLTPKKKFGFKNRSKVGKGATEAKTADGGPTIAASFAAHDQTVAVAAKVDTFQAPAGCHGFRDQQGATLHRPAGEGIASDFALENLEGCDVRLLSPTTVLWIRGLRRCTVFAVPVKGSIYVTACEDCTIVVGSRQLRIHTSSRVDFYVHASSHPIIEHCTDLRFAPYPTLPLHLACAFETAGLCASQNQWQLVDDFNWLKATHSPNWAVLPEAERTRPAALDSHSPAA